MNSRFLSGNTLLLAVCVVLFASEDAHAYLDPGTGTLIIQWIFGMVVAGMAAARVYWSRAKLYFEAKFGSPAPVDDSASDDSPEAR
ncbi:MAG: hypothetical protein AAF660_04925 [Pseudomonadota bacterium]